MGMRSIAACLASLFCACSQTALAQDSVEQFYRGRTVTITVGSAAGGGYDIYARLMSRHLGRHIPGSPNVIVQNMPGAGSNRAAGYIANQAAKDGTAIGTIQAGSIMWPLMSDQPLQHDPSKFIMLGSANRSVYLCVVRSDAQVKSFKEAFEKEIIIGTSGEGATLRELPVMLVNTLGVRLKLVGGYAGSREIGLAMTRNEVQGMCGMDWSSLITQQRDWIDSRFAHVIVQEDLIGHPQLNKQGVPLATAFAATDEARQVMEVVYSQNMFGRPYLLPSGVPADRVEALRSAFAATMRDELLLAEAAQLQLDISPMSGVELQELIARLYARPQAVVESVKRSLIYKPEAQQK